MSPGPEPASKPLENTIGKIAIPASIATVVSAMAILKEVLAIEVSFGK